MKRTRTARRHRVAVGDSRMDRTTPPALRRFSRWWRRYARLAVVALPLVGAGCADLRPATDDGAKPSAPAVSADPVARMEVPRVQAPARPEALPLPDESKPAAKPEMIHAAPTPAPAAAPAPAAPIDKVLPVSLDLVLRLAQEQNTQVALAREKLR